jgi:hypothetical protein
MKWFQTLMRAFGRRHSPHDKYWIKEQAIPVGKNGKPDLSYYDDPLQHYIDLYELSMQGSISQGVPPSYRWNCRVHATWGLLTKRAESVPYLIELLSRGNSDAHEDAAYLLGELSKDEEVSQLLLSMLDSEENLVAKGAIVAAIGKLGSKAAVPKLAELITATDTDEVILEDAIVSLGRIARKRFTDSENPREQAMKWLVANGQKQ